MFIKHLLCANAVSGARNGAVPMAPGGAYSVFGAVVKASDKPTQLLN